MLYEVITISGGSSILADPDRCERLYHCADDRGVDSGKRLAERGDGVSSPSGGTSVLHSAGWSGCAGCQRGLHWSLYVITSYSIHYTKLYEPTEIGLKLVNGIEREDLNNKSALLHQSIINIQCFDCSYNFV